VPSIAYDAFEFPPESAMRFDNAKIAGRAYSFRAAGAAASEL